MGSGKEEKLNIIGLIKRKWNIKEDLGNLSKLVDSCNINHRVHSQKHNVERARGLAKFTRFK